MPDLTTLQNVKDWLSITDNNSDKVLQRLVTSESSNFLNLINRGNFISASYTETRDGTGTDSMILLNFPVTAVASLTVDTVSVPASPDGVKPGFKFDQYGIYLIGTCGYPALISGGSPVGYPAYFRDGRGNVVVTYTAGYATVPNEVEQAVIDMISYKFRNKDRIGVVSEASQGMTTAYSQKDIPPSAQMVINQYKRNTAIPR